MVAHDGSQGQQLVVAASDGQAVEALKCYRMLDAHPKRRVRVKVGCDLDGFRSWDMVVEEHSIDGTQGDGFLVCNRPLLSPDVSRFQAAQVFGLSELVGLPQEVLRDAITGWEMSNRTMSFSCEPGFEVGEDWSSCSKACEALMDSGAVPDCESGLVIINDDKGLLASLQFLEKQGMVEQMGNGDEATEWKLTCKGIQHIEGHLNLSAPKFLLQRDAVTPLHICSPYCLWDYLCMHGCCPEAIMGGRGLKHRIQALPSFMVGVDQRFFLYNRASRLYLLALAMAVERHNPDEPLPIKHMQSDVYYGQVVRAIDDDIAMQVLHDLEQNDFEDEGGLALQDDRGAKPKGKRTVRQRKGPQQNAIMDAVVITIENGDGNDECFEPDPADDEPAPKQRRLRGKQPFAVHPPTPRPPATPISRARPTVGPSANVEDGGPSADAAPPSWQADLHPDDLELLDAHVSGSEDEQEVEQASSCSSHSEDGVVNPRQIVRLAVRGEPWKKVLIGKGDACVGMIVVNELNGGLSLGAHCNCVEHARPCRLNRTCRPHRRAGPGMDFTLLSVHDQAQGRPLGLLVSWLMHSHTFGSKRGDKGRARKRHKDAASNAESIVARLASRRAARKWLSELAEEDEQVKYLMSLERNTRRREVFEPPGLCGGS